MQLRRHARQQFVRMLPAVGQLAFQEALQLVGFMRLPGPGTPFGNVFQQGIAQRVGQRFHQHGFVLRRDIARNQELQGSSYGLRRP
jgi:hypothetical protein